MVKQIGLIQDQYEEFVIPRLMDEDATEFPLSAADAVEVLRGRGYVTTADKLRKLAMDGTVRLPQTSPRNGRWDRQAVDIAAAYYEKHGAFTPHAECCRFLGITMAEWEDALKSAFDEVRQEFGDQATMSYPNPDYFTLHVTPATYTVPASIDFTLADHVQAELGQLVTK